MPYTRILVSGYWLLVTALCGCGSHHLYTGNRVLMGTFVEVSSPDRRAPAIVFDEIKRIEKLLSKYIDDSEVSRLNREGSLKASADTFYVVSKSKEFWQLSDGAFDITAAALVDLWGFTHKKYRLPGEDEIKEALKLVGSEKIVLDSQANVIEFSVPGMRIDLGAIAKGFALDCAVGKLKEAGIKSCLINAGGQVYGLGDNFGRPWKVALKSARGPGYKGSLELNGESVSTSGDYEQFFEQGSRRYSHIINPATGYPADSGVISVTVVAKEAIVADALSTAIFVAGREKGAAIAARFPGVRTEIIQEKNQ